MAVPRPFLTPEEDISKKQKRRVKEQKRIKNIFELSRSNLSYTKDTQKEALLLAQKEINTKRSQYPSVTLSSKTEGDPRYAQLFHGEANKLLYQLKNLMKFRNLGQLKMTRPFSDGTVITAWSFISPITGVSQDFVKIDVSQSIAPTAGVVGLVPSCVITFIDLPDVVQPMKYPGEIHSGEVQGLDYFKTYYTFQVDNCDDCQDIGFEFLLTYDTPIESRHFHNYASIPQMGVLSGEDDLVNHMVYSMEFPCWAEIISQGTDTGGKYIIWKAYTESLDVQSRTGLAIPLLRAIINQANGTELCRQEAKFDVDCCVKSPLLRKVEIWWEGIWECEPFIIYGDYHICKMPGSVPIVGSGGLIAYSTPFYAARPLYSIPEIKGLCLPVEWTLTGPIRFSYSGKNDHTIYFQIEEGVGCHDQVGINLKDRCGTDYTVMGTPCCDNPAPLTINYISLLMSCSQQQIFSATGGCGPYSWSVTSGGGTIDDGGTYTAPATNVNCVDNPTIQVTDCCGSTAEIKLAINCYTQVGTALEDSSYTQCGDCVQMPTYWYVHANWRVKQYNCDGILTNDCQTNADCTGHTLCAATCPPMCGNPDCSTVQCGGGGCGLVDVRSPTYKSLGCCPINPLTGLPYD